MEKTMKPGIVESIIAPANISKHRFIGFDGNYCAANAKALGVSQVDMETNQRLPVTVSGIVLVETGGAITLGQAVVSGANGVAVAATAFSITVGVPAGGTPVTSDAAQPNLTETLAGSVLPQSINGYTLDTAAGSGETIRVKLV